MGTRLDAPDIQSLGMGPSHVMLGLASKRAARRVGSQAPK